MSRPIVLLNNLVFNENAELKRIPQIFIIFQTVFGVNRLCIFATLNSTIKYILHIISIVIHLIIIIKSFKVIMKENLLKRCIISIGLTQYYITVFLAVKDSGGILRLLQHFEVFDYKNRTFACKLDNWRECAKTVFKLLIILSIVIISFLSPLTFVFNENILLVFHFILVEIGINYEMLFYTYLYKNIQVRIKYLSDSLEEFLNESFMSNELFFNDDKKYCFKYKKIITQSEYSYKMIAESAELLYHFTKLQMTIGVISAFIPAIINGYFAAFGIVTEEEITLQWAIVGIICAVSIANDLYCMSGPCLISSQIQAEVQNIRRYLATFLCSNDLDKEAKQSTREFVSLVETMPIKFTLLRMMDMNKLLPLRLIHLVVTYLIILLQFGKIVENTMTKDFINR